MGSQEIPAVTGKLALGVQNEAGQRLTKCCQEYAMVIAVKPSSNNTRDDSTHGHHQMVNTEIRFTILFAAKDGEALYTQQKQDWADCDSDHELFIAKFRLQLKKIGKSTRQFRYHLNQIPYTVEVRNRFKGLDLIDRVPEELWMKVHNILQEVVIKIIPKKKKCK